MNAWHTLSWIAAHYKFGWRCFEISARRVRAYIPGECWAGSRREW